MQLEVSAEGFKTAQATVVVGISTNEVLVRLVWDDGSKSEWERGMQAAPTVRLTGTVVDAESGEPLPKFRLTLDEHRGTSSETERRERGGGA